MSKWEPWVMVNGQRHSRLQLGREFNSRKEVSEFFTYMWKTHPELEGQHIEFEEILDRDPPAVI